MGFLHTKRCKSKTAMDNGLVDKNNYQAFGRGHGYFKSTNKISKNIRAKQCFNFQPKQDLGLTQIQLDAINAVTIAIRRSTYTKQYRTGMGFTKHERTTDITNKFKSIRIFGCNRYAFCWINHSQFIYRKKENKMVK